VHLQFQYRYCRITHAGFYSFLFFFEFVRSLKMIKFIAPHVRSGKITVLKTIRHLLKLAVLDLRRDLDPYQYGFYEELADKVC